MIFTVVFTDDLQAIKFIDEDTGETADPRMVLGMLAEGRARVTYKQERHGLRHGHVLEEIWRVVFEGKG